MQPPLPEYSPDGASVLIRSVHQHLPVLTAAHHLELALLFAEAHGSVGDRKRLKRAFGPIVKRALKRIVNSGELVGVQRIVLRRWLSSELSECSFVSSPVASALDESFHSLETDFLAGSTPPTRWADDDRALFERLRIGEQYQRVYCAPEFLTVLGGGERTGEYPNSVDQGTVETLLDFVTHGSAYVSWVRESLGRGGASTKCYFHGQQRLAFPSDHEAVEGTFHYGLAHGPFVVTLGDAQFEAKYRWGLLQPTESDFIPVNPQRPVQD